MKANNTSGQKQMTNRKFTFHRSFIAVCVALLIATCFYQLWLIWPSLVLKSIQWQREVNAQLADLLYDAKTDPLTAGGYLIGFSFLYGMLHSLGPGHGKVIVTTYLATHPTKLKASLILTVVSALCQALVAIGLVSVLVWGYSASMRAVNQQATFFVSLSFSLVIILGTMICWKSVKKIYRAISPSKPQIVSLTPLASQHTNENKQTGKKPADISAVFRFSGKPVSSHTHNAECGCGHKHVADAEAINNASTWKEYIGIAATIGVRPCTGAIMVLLFSNIAHLYWMGVISAIVMAIGTAFTTSFIAVMTLTGKHFVKRYLMPVKSSNAIKWNLAGYVVQLFGGLFLIIVGLILTGGSNSAISPLFSG